MIIIIKGILRHYKQLNLGFIDIPINFILKILNDLNVQVEYLNNIFKINTNKI
uniref:Uncharacterized protein n=1 Tax=viral metagenome TaxID=1070528 RepID=A0A6C0ETS4_9ZZZZ